MLSWGGVSSGRHRLERRSDLKSRQHVLVEDVPVTTSPFRPRLRSFRPRIQVTSPTYTGHIAHVYKKLHSSLHIKTRNFRTTSMTYWTYEMRWQWDARTSSIYVMLHFVSLMDQEWKEWEMKCGECSQGPDGIPGQEVSRFKYDP